MILKTRTRATERMTAVVKVENPAINMETAEGRLVSLGNKILARDDEARTFTVAQAIQHHIIEAGTFIPDVEAIALCLLPANTTLSPCPDCKDGVAFNACATCTDGKVRETSTVIDTATDGTKTPRTVVLDRVCGDCDGGGNDLGGSCIKCGGHGKVAAPAEA